MAVNWRRIGRRTNKEEKVQSSLPESGVTVSRFKPLHRHKRSIFVLAGLLIFVLIATYTVLNFRNNNNKKNVYEHKVCSAETIKEALPFLLPPYHTDLKPTVNKIKRLHAYDTDVNCLYIALIYGINTSNTAESKVLLDKLEKTYDPKIGYSPALETRVKSLDLLREMVAATEKQDEELIRNSKAMSGIKDE